MDCDLDLTVGLALTDFQQHANAILARLTADLSGRLKLVAGAELEADPLVCDLVATSLPTRLPSGARFGAGDY